MVMYVLDAVGNPVPEPDTRKAAEFFSKDANRIVAQHDVENSRVSTVFLGVDHSHGSGMPVLWETMVFGGHLDQHQERYTSHEAAVAGHMAILRSLADFLGKPVHEVAIGAPPPGYPKTIYDHLLEDEG